MFRYKRRLRSLCLGILIFSVPCLAGAEGLSEAASLSTRNRYQASGGIIVPRVEIQDDSYIAIHDYGYPEPETDLGFYLYNHLDEETSAGREGVLHIGVQSRSRSFQEIPPLNLAFVIDTSDSMNNDEKIAWVKDSLGSFVSRVRAMDALALVSFNDEAYPLFESALMDSAEKQAEFLDALNGLSAQGDTNLESGIRTGYEQVMLNYRPEAVNLVLLISDGNEFSGRRSEALAHSGDIGITLVWNNRNDLDLHVITPGEEEIFFGNMKDSTGGWLDVDRNVNGETTEPVENVFWYTGDAAPGRYQVWVRNYEYHDSEYLTPFKVEVKNGADYQYFNGETSGTGDESDVLVWSFDFGGSAALSPIYELVEINKETGISISTMGVGGDFDEELLRTLAEYGQGSSRSLQNREVMMQIFDSDREFERFAIPASGNFQGEIEFSSGIEVLDAWGYHYTIEGNRISCELPDLHMGDYRTLLIRYRIPAGNREQQTAIIKTTELYGSAYVSNAEWPLVLADISDNRIVTFSRAMADFAVAAQEIGDRYYTGESPARFGAALEQARTAEQSLGTARQNLGDIRAFEAELAVIARYIELLTEAQNNIPPETEVAPVAPETEAAPRRSRMSTSGGRYSRMSAD